MKRNAPHQKAQREEEDGKPPAKRTTRRASSSASSEQRADCDPADNKRTRTELDAVYPGVSQETLVEDAAVRPFQPTLQSTYSSRKIVSSNGGPLDFLHRFCRNAI